MKEDINKNGVDAESAEIEQNKDSNNTHESSTNFSQRFQSKHANNQNAPDQTDAINELNQKVADLNEKLLRSLAEVDNVRRRSREEVERASKYSISGFVSDLVVVAENFFLASDNAPKEELESSVSIKNFSDAVFMTKKELMKVLEKNNVKRIFPVEEKFNHNLHEAVAEVESNLEAGTVVQVIQAGYSLGDRLIKPAIVVVSKGVVQS